MRPDMRTGRISLVRTLLTQGLPPSSVVTLLQIRSALRGCRSALDVGCGPGSNLKHFGFDRLVGIDGYEPNVMAARRDATHDCLVLGDVRKLGDMFRENEFDACVALDLIEHLTKAEGLALLQSMERIAARRVVLLTPNGFLPQRHAEQSDLQEHLSGWDCAEMRALGYRVVGALGPKCLRGEYHRIRWKPAALWSLVSLAGHFLFTRWVPARAAAILCIKAK